MAEQGNSILVGVLGTTVTGVVLGALAPVWLFTFGPNGTTKPIPQCSQEHLCIVVAGLDNDVYWNPFSGGGGNLVDFRDADTQRMVRWVRPIAQRLEPNIEVKRYPREINTPNPGTVDEDKQRLQLKKTVDEIIARTRADIVLVGSVEEADQRYQVVFMRPGEDLPQDLPTYMVSGTQAPQDFEKALRNVLQEARAGRGPKRFIVDPKIVAPVDIPVAPAAPPPPAKAVPQPEAIPLERAPPQESLAPEPVQSAPPPVIESTPAPVPVRQIRATINNPGAGPQPALDDLYSRTVSARARPGPVTIECTVSVFGDLTQCQVLEAPPGAERFGRAFAGFAEQRLKGEPARSNGIPEPGKARLTIQTRGMR